ncbi:hypothetical protein RFI_20928 [Reticulomyxa filosa]|uniref:Uncharacterized protein n=1 Tax=Reticulomyxa filosa TaxID=46433 RepID=X6MRZ8_RETFI|nr:hypothetical protein RFI_20928 [Reticulomyxa filosa]|eukprot:ETO16411.1 hypothetical protein RFI_20928 [Reticulomyxa filosa]
MTLHTRTRLGHETSNANAKDNNNDNDNDNDNYNNNDNDNENESVNTSMTIIRRGLQMQKSSSSSSDSRSENSHYQQANRRTQIKAWTARSFLAASSSVFVSTSTSSSSQQPINSAETLHAYRKGGNAGNVSQFNNNRMSIQPLKKVSLVNDAAADDDNDNEKNSICERERGIGKEEKFDSERSSQATWSVESSYVDNNDKVSERSMAVFATSHKERDRESGG